MQKAKIPLTTGVTLEIDVNDAIVQVATGMTINQAAMCRAVFEDIFCVDPATLTIDEMLAMAKQCPWKLEK